MIVGLTIGTVVSALVAAALTAVVIPLLRRAQVMDVPVGRSLHAAPIPRGGGLAIILATAVCSGIAPSVTWRLEGLEHLSARFDVIMLGVLTVLAFAIVGLAEDLFSLPASARFMLQVGLGLLMGLGVIIETGRPLWLVLPVALCTATLVNVTNFMDGANGLASLHAIVTCTWFAVVSLVHPVPGLGFVMVALGGACLGFLPFNSPRARVFLGDSGSYALGGAWSFGAALCLAEGAPVSASVAPLLVLVADTGYTLWMRVRAGQRWYEPHKLHVYQRLVSAGWPHLASALLVSGVAVVCCALAAHDLLTGRTTWLLAAQLVVLLVYLRMPAMVKAPNPFHRPRSVR